MSIDSWIAQSTKKLIETDIPSARLDCLILLEDALHKDRSWILANPEHILSEANISKLEGQLTRRASHEPLAYIREKKEFYGREFLVTPVTLQPRPETETIIDLLLKNSEENKHIIDVGTGSGCLAITAKIELPKSTVIAVDVSEDALKIAEKNAKKHSTDIAFYRGDLLEPLISSKIQSPNIILANLPYVPTDYTINQAATHEPKLAIFGGKDGLDLYRRMFEQLTHLNAFPRFIYTESLIDQHSDLAEIANQKDYEQIDSKDLIQVFELKLN